MTNLLAPRRCFRLCGRSSVLLPYLVRAGSLDLVGLALVVDLDDPVVRHDALLPGLALVSPRLLPLARALVELLALHAPLLPGLGLDALLGGELLPLGRLLGGRQRLLTRERRGDRGQVEQDALLGRLQGQGGQQLVDEGLGAVAGGLGQAVLQVDGSVGGGQGVGVVGEQEAEVECVRRRLGDLHL